MRTLLAKNKRKIQKLSAKCERYRDRNIEVSNNY